MFTFIIDLFIFLYLVFTSHNFISHRQSKSYQ